MGDKSPKAAHKHAVQKQVMAFAVGTAGVARCGMGSDGTGA